MEIFPLLLRLTDVALFKSIQARINFITIGFIASQRQILDQIGELLDGSVVFRSCHLQTHV